MFVWSDIILYGHEKKSTYKSKNMNIIEKNKNLSAKKNSKILKRRKKKMLSSANEELGGNSSVKQTKE